jgi:hypothetical protein
MRTLLIKTSGLILVCLVFIATAVSSYAAGSGNQVTDAKQPKKCKTPTRDYVCKEFNSTAKKVTYNVCIFNDVATPQGWYQGTWDGRKTGTDRFTSKRACTNGVDVYVKDGGMDTRIGPTMSSTRKVGNVYQASATAAQEAFNLKNTDPTNNPLTTGFCYKGERNSIPITMVECTGYYSSEKNYCSYRVIPASPNKGVTGQWWTITTNATGTKYAICKGGVELVSVSDSPKPVLKLWGDTSYSITAGSDQNPIRCFTSASASTPCKQTNCKMKDGTKTKGTVTAAASCTDTFETNCEAQVGLDYRYDYVGLAGGKCRCDRIATVPNFKKGCCWDSTFTGSAGYWKIYTNNTGSAANCSSGILVEAP